MKVSIRQLAEYCHVSIGTVDRVLHNRGGVKPETQERVEQAIRQFGYAPNYVASSLSVGKTMSIGVVLLHLNNLFFAQMAEAIVKQADECGYFTYLTLSEKSVKKECDCIRNLVARQVDGILLFSTNQEEDFLAYLRTCNVPVVTVMTELPGFPGVRIDDFQAMADATRYVVAKQYQRIVYISPPLSYTAKMNIRVQESRYRGFLSIIRESGADYEVIDDGEFLGAIGQMDFKKTRTAFLCSSDIYAIDILRFLRLRGLRTPYDYGLMGFDSIQILQSIEPSIATVSVPIEDVGRTAVRTLIDRINGRDATTGFLPHAVVPGQTIV